MLMSLQTRHLTRVPRTSAYWTSVPLCVAQHRSAVAVPLPRSVRATISALVTRSQPLRGTPRRVDWSRSAAVMRRVTFSQLLLPRAMAAEKNRPPGCQAPLQFLQLRRGTADVFHVRARRSKLGSHPPLLQGLAATTAALSGTLLSVLGRRCALPFGSRSSTTTAGTSWLFAPPGSETGASGTNRPGATTDGGSREPHCRESRLTRGTRPNANKKKAPTKNLLSCQIGRGRDVARAVDRCHRYVPRLSRATSDWWSLGCLV